MAKKKDIEVPSEPVVHSVTAELKIYLVRKENQTAETIDPTKWVELGWEVV
jgi:hypothetical protein